jgi:hypothetical protein
MLIRKKEQKLVMNVKYNMFQISTDISFATFYVTDKVI